MNRATKIAGFILVTLFGVYGCAKGPADGTDRGSAPASRTQRLEEDLRAASAARDQLRQKLLAAEERSTQLQKQLEKERAELKARTTERDTIATQYDGFRKNLKELIGQAENALANPNGSGGSTAPASTIGAEVAPMPSEAGSGSGN